MLIHAQKIFSSAGMTRCRRRPSCASYPPAGAAAAPRSTARRLALCTYARDRRADARRDLNLPISPRRPATTAAHAVRASPSPSPRRRRPRPEGGRRRHLPARWLRRVLVVHQRRSGGARRPRRASSLSTCTSTPQEPPSNSIGVGGVEFRTRHVDEGGERAEVQREVRTSPAAAASLDEPIVGRPGTDDSSARRRRAAATPPPPRSAARRRSPSAPHPRRSFLGVGGDQRAAAAVDLPLRRGGDDASPSSSSSVLARSAEAAGTKLGWESGAGRETGAVGRGVSSTSIFDQRSCFSGGCSGRVGAFPIALAVASAGAPRGRSESFDERLPSCLRPSSRARAAAPPRRRSEVLDGARRCGFLADLCRRRGWRRGRRRRGLRRLGRRRRGRRRLGLRRLLIAQRDRQDLPRLVVARHRHERGPRERRRQPISKWCPGCTPVGTRSAGRLADVGRGPAEAAGAGNVIFLQTTAGGAIGQWDPQRLPRLVVGRHRHAHGPRERRRQTERERLPRLHARQQGCLDAHGRRQRPAGCCRRGQRDRLANDHRRLLRAAAALARRRHGGRGGLGDRLLGRPPRRRRRRLRGRRRLRRRLRWRLRLRRRLRTPAAARAAATRTGPRR